VGKRLICAFAFLCMLPGISEARHAIVDSPSICVKVDKVDGDRVYLVTTSAKCPNGPGKVEVTLSGDPSSADIYVDGALWRKQLLGVSGSELALHARKRADEMAEDLKVPTSMHLKSASAKARESADLANSKEFQDKLNAEYERLRNGIFSGSMAQIPDYYADLDGKGKKTPPGRLPANERIYVFISSSVPMETLRNYAIAIDRLNDPNIVMVMRGMVNTMSRMADTGRFVMQIVKKVASCDPVETKCATYTAPVDIDPLLFRRYGIDRVPAVVYAKDVTVRDEGSEGLDENLAVGNSFTLLGDVSLEHALEVFKREPGNESLDKVIARFHAD